MDQKSLVKETLGQRWARSWNEFWFSPMDPTVLGAIRICCGLITLYTVIAYSFAMHEFVGPNAWYGLEDRLDDVRNRPVLVLSNLNGTESGGYFRGPETPEEETYANAYLKNWGEYPPPPYPKSADEIKICDEFREKARGLQDLRRFNLPIPTNRQQLEYVYEFYARYGMPP